MEYNMPVREAQATVMSGRLSADACDISNERIFSSCASRRRFSSALSASSCKNAWNEQTLMIQSAIIQSVISIVSSPFVLSILFLLSFPQLYNSILRVQLIGQKNDNCRNVSTFADTKKLLLIYIVPSGNIIHMIKKKNRYGGNER